MENPINSVSSRIQGMQASNLREPKIIGEYKYHLMFATMDNAWEMSEILCKEDERTIITSKSRPNMYLAYNPFLKEKSPDFIKEWVQWQYFECVKITFGYYGREYYLFGSGKIFYELPELVD